MGTCSYQLPFIDPSHSRRGGGSVCAPWVIRKVPEKKEGHNIDELEDCHLGETVPPAHSEKH